MKDRRGEESIDRFLETAGTEKGIHLRSFALQRSADRRVLKNPDPALRLQLRQRLLQAKCVTDRFLHELFDQRLTHAFSIRRPKPAPNPQIPANPTPAISTDSPLSIITTVRSRIFATRSG